MSELPNICENVLTPIENIEAKINKASTEEKIDFYGKKIQKLFGKGYTIKGELSALTFARYRGDYDGYCWYVRKGKKHIATFILDFKVDDKYDHKREIKSWIDSNEYTEVLKRFAQENGFFFLQCQIEECQYIDLYLDDIDTSFHPCETCAFGRIVVDDGR